MKEPSPSAHALSPTKSTVEEVPPRLGRPLFVSVVIALAPLANRHIGVIRRYPAGRQFTARAGRAEDHRRAVPGERRLRVALRPDQLVDLAAEVLRPLLPNA